MRLMVHSPVSPSSGERTFLYHYTNVLTTPKNFSTFPSLKVFEGSKGTFSKKFPWRSLRRRLKVFLRSKEESHTEHERIIQMTHLTPADGKTGFQFQLCGVTYPYRGYLIRRPESTVSCLETVRSGKGTVILDGHSYSLGAGDSYLLPEGHNHEYFADRNDPWEKVWVNFSGVFSLSLLRLFGLDGACVFRGLDLSDLLFGLQTCCTESDPARAAEQCTGMMAQAFARMSASLCRQTDAPRSPAQELKGYIDRHITEPLDTGQLAAVIGRSASQAQRLFREAFGVPLYRYILERKLALACRLLRETGMSVRGIAAYLSFSDEFYFSGLFRRKIGTSPSRYRAASADAGMQPEHTPDSIRKTKEDHTES